MPQHVRVHAELELGGDTGAGGRITGFANGDGSDS